MHSFEIMSAIWFVALAAFTVLMIVRGHLTQHEIPELFLDDNADESFRKSIHDDVVRRVNQINPYCKSTAGITAALTVLILSAEVVRALPYVHF